MSDPQKAHELVPSDPHSVGDQDIVFDCPFCHKNLVIDHIAAGHELDCPMCGKAISVPQPKQPHRVVTLAEAPETDKLHSKPAWEQELLSVESAIREHRHQREEAGNAYNHHASEANRAKFRTEKIDEKLKELETRRTAIKAEHPQS